MRRFTLLELLVVVALVGLVAAFGVGAIAEHQTQAHRLECGNRLRALANAAICYADDKRFFPHVGPLSTLDGGIESNDAPRTVRALLWYGYYDMPEVFTCPASDDVPIEGRWRLKDWFWKGRSTSTPRVAPWVDGLTDPTLEATTELSYGWTRRSWASGVRGTTLLAADRARRTPRPGKALPGYRGNHADGWNVISTDGTLRWVTPTEQQGLAWLTRAGPGGGYLGLAAEPKSP